MFISAKEPGNVGGRRNLGGYLSCSLDFIDEGSWPRKTMTCPESCSQAGLGPEPAILTPKSSHLTVPMQPGY